MPDSLGSEPELRPFVRDGRIVTMPAKRAKRRLLLDRVAQEFEPGRRYREAEVNAVLKTLCDDHAALRRYLVDEELMSRESGVYWRTGGTVDTGEAAGTGEAGGAGGPVSR
jgi:hypothetical protein